MGSVVWNTIWAVSPDWVGNDFCRKVWARADSEPPPLNLFWKSAPTAWEATVMAITTSSHSTSTRLRWSKLQPARRDRAPAGLGAPGAPSRVAAVAAPFWVVGSSPFRIEFISDEF